MKPQILFAGVLASAVFFSPAIAAGDDALARMALCKDSWTDWSKNDPARMKAFAARFRTQFVSHENDSWLVPKASVSVMGLRVTKAFPDSVGMGVGFSLMVDATYDDARKAAETALGKSLGKCESSDNMRACALKIVPQRTFMLMTEDKPGARETLIGCYYFYEQ